MVSSAPRTDSQDAGVPSATAVVDLLNSRPYASLADKLDSPELAARVLRPFGQENGTVPRKRLELVRAIRSELLNLAGAPTTEDGAEDWARLTARVSTNTYSYDFSTPGGVQLRQVTGDPVVGRITQAVAVLVEAGNWTRVRFCANDDCREAFYDTTRSRTRRWHSYEYCGNRTNVATHRARAADGGNRSSES